MNLRLLKKKTETKSEKTTKKEDTLKNKDLDNESKADIKKRN